MNPPYIIRIIPVMSQWDHCHSDLWNPCSYPWYPWWWNCMNLYDPSILLHSCWYPVESPVWFSMIFTILVSPILVRLQSQYVRTRSSLNSNISSSHCMGLSENWFPLDPLVYHLTSCPIDIGGFICKTQPHPWFLAMCFHQFQYHPFA